MFESHLGDEKGQQGDARRAHGRIVRAQEIPDHIGGSRGSLKGAPAAPDARAPTVKGLPREAANWEGSDTHYRSSELPTSTPDGRGFRGSAAILNASDLERIDGRRRPDAAMAGEGAAAQQQTLQHQALQPGIYQLSDGNVLVVAPNGQQQQVITRQQYEAWVAQQQVQQAQQAPAPSLMNRVLRSVRR